jgi:GxxExxY protein
MPVVWIKLRGLSTAKQVPMPLIYKEKKLELGRIDLLVDEKVIIEVKSVDALNPVHMAQVMTYLKLSGCRIGLLLNFNVQFLKDGIRRIIIWFLTMDFTVGKNLPGSRQGQYGENIPC